MRNNGHRTRQETASSCRISQCGADYLEIFDAAHSEFEDRFIAIGSMDRGLAIVVYTEPEDDLIRIEPLGFSGPDPGLVSGG